MNDRNPLTSIIIPVFNDAGNIEACLETLDDALRGIPRELLVCYDSNEDDTVSAVEAMPEKPAGLRLIKNMMGPGSANAVGAGIEAAEGDVIVVMNADLSDDPTFIPEMARKIREEGCSVVCGSRFMKGCLSKSAGFALSLIGLKTKDPTTNYRAYSAAFLNRIDIESRKDFEIGLELTVKAFIADGKICDIPVSRQNRCAGTSHVQISGGMPYYLKWSGKALWHSLKQNFLFAILSFLFLIMAVSIVTHTIIEIYSTPNAVYFWDQWRLVDILDKYMHNKLTVSDLIAQHNEHRFLFLRLFYLLDLILFSGKNWLLRNLLTINQLMICLTFCLLARNQFKNIFRSLWYFALVFICLFSGIQGETLIWPFQVAFLGTQLGLVVSVYLASKLVHNAVGFKKYWLIFGAIAAAVYSSFSLSSGIIAFPLIIMIALYNRIKIRTLLPFMVSAICVYAIFFHHYKFPPQHNNPLQSFTQVSAIISYVLCYIGGPFQYIMAGKNILVSQIMGLGGIFLFVLYIFYYSLEFRRISPNKIAFICIAVYVLLSALMTALGRIKFGNSQALASKYTSISLLFWLSIIYLYYTEIDQCVQGKNWWMSASLIAVIIFCGGVTAGHLNVLDKYKTDFLQREIIGNNIRLGFASSDGYKKLFFNEKILMNYLDILRKNRLGIYDPDYLDGRFNDLKNISVQSGIKNGEKWKQKKNFIKYGVDPTTDYDDISKLLTEKPDMSLLGSFGQKIDTNMGELISKPFKANKKMVILCVAGYPINNEISIINLDKKDKIQIHKNLGIPREKWRIASIALPGAWGNEDRLQLKAVNTSRGQHGWFGISEPLVIGAKDAGTLTKTYSKNCKNMFDIFTDNQNMETNNCIIKKNGNQILIRSNGNDPHFILPKPTLTEGVIKILRIKIKSPQMTNFEVFYHTSFIIRFDRKYAIRRTLKKGENEFVFILPPVSWGNIRLDPGTVPGDYIIEDISICQLNP